jgi:hypothetical protein
VAAVCFQHLLASPGSLLADGSRPSIDHAERGGTRGLGNDLTRVALPRFLMILRQWSETGKVPLWDPSGFAGRPLIGNPQAGLMYPPYWVALASGRPASLGWLTVGHLIWAGLGVYGLARAIGLGRWGAAFAGGCYEASPYLIGHTAEGHYAHVWGACWYPWAFWAVIAARRGSRFGLWSLPVVLALSFLTGHPQEWYFLVLALAAWAGFDAIEDLRARGPAVAAWGLLVGAGLLALSLGPCAAELVPGLTARGWLLEQEGAGAGQVSRYFVHSINLVQLLDPFALGRPWDYRGHDNYWETVFSIGLVPLVLGFVGASRHPDRPMARRLAWLVVVALVFAAGQRLGLYSLARMTIPGVDRFRVPSRTLFLASLGGALLAGAGLNELSSGRLATSEWAGLRERLRRALLIVGGSVLAIGLVSVFVVEESATRGWGSEKRTTTRTRARRAELNTAVRAVAAVGEVGAEPIFWMSLAGMAAGVSLASRLGARRDVLAWGLGSLGLVELSLYARAILVCAPVTAFLGSDRVLNEVQRGTEGESGRFRAASIGTLLPDLTAMASGLEKTNVNDSFQIRHAADIYERLYPFLEPFHRRETDEWPMDRAVWEHRARLARTVLDLMSVRVLVADRDVSPLGLDPGMAAPTPGDEPRVWKNPTALPRAYVTPRAVTMRDDPALILHRLGIEGPREGVVMTTHDPLAPGDRQSYTPASFDQTDPDRVVVRVTTSAPGLLVVGNTWMPGWSATVDGVATAVLRGNHCQQVIPLAGAGSHTVVLEYRTPGLGLGIGLSLVCLLGWGGGGAALVTRRAGRANHQGVIRPSRDASGPTIRGSAGSRTGAGTASCPIPCARSG